MSILTRVVVLALAVGFAAAAWGADAYYDIPLSSLNLVDGKLPERKKVPNWRNYEAIRAMRPYAALDCPGEAFVAGPPESWLYFGVPIVESPAGATRATDTAFHLLIRAPQDKEIKGRIIAPNSELTGMVALEFVVPASVATAEAKKAFFDARMAFYQFLLDRDLPGGAWFRHEIRLTRNELKLPAVEPANTPTRWRNGRADDLTSTYDLFTGGRALSENLQLDRTLPPLRPNEKPVKIESLTGITIAEIDWKPLLKDAKPKLDPLAATIPADQHTVFFPTFQAALAMSDETKQYDTPVLRLADPRSENAGVVERYQRQLGLPLSTMARLLGPTLVKSVALTGGDPSFPVGTDLAVLFESPQPKSLENLLYARIGLAASTAPGVQFVQAQIDGLGYRGVVTPDRSLSSYVAVLGDAVVVTNSTYQLKRLVAVHKGTAKSIASLPEYAFFRTRYPLEVADTSGLIFLSDATIRRWCGPQWRIAESRRTRARAVLAELQASQLDALARKTVTSGPIHTDLPILGGEVQLTPTGVVSPVYGTLDFMTPIGELSVDEVTQAEADAYQAWRDGYQRNWSWAFDPIGLQISLGKQKLAADLTVMPLIMSTEYREFTDLSLGGKFDSQAGDPHDAMVQFILAINHKSSYFRQGENFLSMMGQTASLGWIGSSVSVYADDDSFWKDLAKVKEEELSNFMERNIARLPVAVRIESSNPLKLAVFLTSARAFIEQTAPGLTAWESLKYKEQPFVQISAVKGENGMPRELENLSIYYTAIDGALTVTFSEKVLRQAIDRWLARQAADGKLVKEMPPWLGSNVALRVDSQILEIANLLGREAYQRTMQGRCWNNLPVLNEWKRRYPDRNPVELHQRLWGVELLCPGGGKYVWNEKFSTMESTVYGHPGQPKAGPLAPPVLSGFATGNFGLTLENEGLRARVELLRPTK